MYIAQNNRKKNIIIRLNETWERAYEMSIFHIQLTVTAPASVELHAYTFCHFM